MIKKRILVVDDDMDIRKVVETMLSKEGFITVGAENAADALRKIRAAVPDLIILDVGLPDQDGFEVCKTLRSEPATRFVPVIMLTAQTMPYYKVTGLEVGADDYVTKPFHHTELMARVKAILRRSDWRGQDTVLKDGPLVVDLQKHAAELEGKSLSLSPKEYELLVLLLHSRGKALTRIELSEAIWGQEYFGSTRTLDVHVGLLRKKLGKLGGRIKTIERVGYRYE